MVQPPAEQEGDMKRSVVVIVSCIPAPVSAAVS